MDGEAGQILCGGFLLFDATHFCEARAHMESTSQVVEKIRCSDSVNFYAPVR